MPLGGGDGGSRKPKAHSPYAHGRRETTSDERKEQQRLQKAEAENCPELIEEVFNDRDRYAQYKRNKTRAELAEWDRVPRLS